MAVAELPRELVVAIARRARHGVVLTTMLQVCRAWRMALTAEIASLWREVALARFPRLQGILAVAEAQSPCFRTLYRNQLEADNKARFTRSGKPSLFPPLPELDQYVITIELLHDDGDPTDHPARAVVVAQTSARLDRALKTLNRTDLTTLVLTKEASYDDRIGSTATAAEIVGMRNRGHNRILVNIYVTRLSDMKSMQLLYVWDILNEQALNRGDEEIKFVYGKLPLLPPVFENTGSNFPSQPAITATFTPRTMEVKLSLVELPHYAQEGVDEQVMTLNEFRRYLALHAEW